MTEIPLERTISDVFRFTFRNILSIFGIAWLALLIGVAAGALVVWWVWPDLMMFMANFDPNSHRTAEAIVGLTSKMLVIGGPVTLLFWVLHAMVNVGMQRKALGLIEGPVYVYFSLDSAVWRLIAAYIVSFLLLYLGVLIVCVGVAVIFVVGDQLHLPGLFVLVEVVAVIAAVCAYIYAAVRLTFFLPPVVVAEGGIGLARSWQLGQGNFWRIVALIIVCVAAPMMGLSMVTNIVALPLMFSTIASMPQGLDPGQVMTPAQFWAIMGPMFKVLVPLLIVFQIVTGPIVMGLSNAVSALAYRAVTRPKNPDPALQ